MHGVLARARRLLAVLALTSTPLAAQQVRTITGKVLEEGSRAPVTAAQLQVQGTAIGALSRDDGGFTLVGVPAADVVVVVRRIGYPLTRITVAAGRSTLEVLLKKDVLNLDQVVVTGQATGISRRNLANDVASVSGADVNRVSAQSLENAFQGKIAGAQISQSTGAPGGGNRIRIRGISCT
jgi:hypothetical protein